MSEVCPPFDDKCWNGPKFEKQPSFEVPKSTPTAPSGPPPKEPEKAPKGVGKEKAPGK